jgi:hypothetical protein
MEDVIVVIEEQRSWVRADDRAARSVHSIGRPLVIYPRLYQCRYKVDIITEDVLIVPYSKFGMTVIENQSDNLPRRGCCIETLTQASHYV